MQNLPTAETYQREVKYMPWGILTSEIIDYVNKNIPTNGVVLDLLCGTGNLITQIQKKRPDIKFVGVDLESEYIEYAKKQNPRAEFVVADAFSWEAKDKFDVVLCTGGLHHIQHDKQKAFVKNISELVKDNGFAIIGDPYIDSYSNETERKIASARLGVEYLIATIKNGATDDVIKAASSLIDNDIFLIEFKDSVKNVEPYFNQYFSKVVKHKTWPKTETQYGDYYFILRK
jgi:2-polyprenyl-3-methyl-5-hydroxy-6-metoxy-1,4-benzoquinol methylase